MNYPAIMTNPLLKKREGQKERVEKRDQIKFSNMARPVSGFQLTSNFQRPFSTKEGGETLMHKRKQLQFAAMPKETSVDQLQAEPKAEPAPLGDRGLPHARSMDRLSSAASGFQFGRSIQSGYHKGRMDGTHIRPDSQVVNADNYTIRSVERVFSAFPQKKPTGKDKKKMEEEKKRQEEEDALKALIPKTETNEQALMTAGGWQNSVNIHKKIAVGTTTTSNYEEKVGAFNKVNERMAESSNMLPLS